MRTVVVFGDAGFTASDVLVPAAVRRIAAHDRLELARVVDVSGEAPAADLGAYLRARARQLGDGRRLALHALRRLAGRRSVRAVPFPARLGRPGAPDADVVCTPDGVHDPAFVDDLAALDPDAILTLGCGVIIEEPLLSLPDLGFVNYHWSYLPEYRGQNSPFWAAYLGARRSGATYHRITEEIDRGRVVARTRVPVRGGVQTLKHDSLVAGRRLLPTVLEKVAEGRLEEGPRLGEGEYFGGADYAAVPRRFDPAVSVAENARRVRAFQELPVRLADRPTVRATAVEERAADRPPDARVGEVVAVGRRGVDVVAGDGVARITRWLYLPAGPLARLAGVESGDVVEGPD